MDEFLKELTMEDLDDEPRSLAETIGMDAFKKLLRVYNGTGQLYIPKLEKVTIPVRNRHICKDFRSGKLSILQIASKYRLSDCSIRQIVREASESQGGQIK